MDSVIIDDGSTQIKIVYRNEQGEIVTAVHNSRGKAGLSNGKNLTSFSDHSYRTPEGDFTICKWASDLLPSNNEKYQTSPLDRCAIHDALRQEGFGGKEVAVIVTLPIESFMQHTGSEAFNKALVEAKKKSVAGDIESAAGNPLANIKAVSVTPESLPAFMDYAMDEKGEWKEGYGPESRVATIDFGGTTTDIALFTGEGNVDSHRSIRCGVSEVSTALKKEIIRAHEAVQEVLPSHLEEIIRTGKSQGQDFSKELLKARQVVFTKIEAELNTLFPDPSQYDLILAVGGGAELFRAELDSWYQKVVIPAEPVSAVARGILKMQGM